MIKQTNYKQTEIGEIPNGWKVTELGQLVSVIGGAPFKSKDFITNGFPVLKIANVKPMKLLLEGLDYISGETAKYYEGAKLKQGDLLITMTGNRYGGGPDSWVGKVAIFNQDDDYYLNQRVGILRCNNDSETDIRFLAYYLGSINLQRKFVMMATGAGGQANISPSQIKALNIPFPKLAEQQQIASILTSLDDKIELNRKMNKTLEEMGKALFKRWFVDFEFPNENGKPYKSSGGGMADSELGEIPQGWKIKDLGEIFEINTKSINPSKHPDQVFWHFSIPSYDQYGSPTLEAGITIKSNKTQIKNRSLLVSKLNPKQEERVWSVYADSWGGNAISSTEFINFVPDGKDWAFANFLFRNDDFYNRFADMSTGSTGSRQRVRPTEAKRLNFVYPSEHLRLQFTKIIDPILVEIDKNVRETMVLKELRDSLLPRLMSGKLRVN